MTPAELRKLIDAATPRPWSCDEPANWHGMAMRIMTKEPDAEVRVSR